MNNIKYTQNQKSSMFMHWKIALLKHHVTQSSLQIHPSEGDYEKRPKKKKRWWGCREKLMYACVATMCTSPNTMERGRTNNARTSGSNHPSSGHASTGNESSSANVICALHAYCITTHHSQDTGSNADERTRSVPHVPNYTYHTYMVQWQSVLKDETLSSLVKKWVELERI